MVPRRQTADPSLQLAMDVAGIDASLRVVAAAPSDDPSEPEMGYYAAELRTLRAAMLQRTDADNAS